MARPTAGAMARTTRASNFEKVHLRRQISTARNVQKKALLSEWPLGNEPSSRTLGKLVPPGTWKWRSGGMGG